MPNPEVARLVQYARDNGPDCDWNEVLDQRSQPLSAETVRELRAMLQFRVVAVPGEKPKHVVTAKEGTQ